MSAFTLTVQTLPETVVCGLNVLTSLQKASIDCPELWEKQFGPRMAEVADCSSGAFGASYGICVMDTPEQGTFHYWAAMPLAQGKAVPEGMSLFTIPAGLYASCPVASLDVLSDAFTYAYMQWPNDQAEYVPAMDLPCLERYGKAFMENGSLEIFIPVRKK